MMRGEIAFFCPDYLITTSAVIEADLLENQILDFGAHNAVGPGTGLFINSPFLQNTLLEQALTRLERDNLAFFDPFVFARSIANALPASINKKLALTSYSATYNSLFLYPLLLDFHYSPLTRALIVNQYQTREHFITELFLLDKNNRTPLVLQGYAVYQIEAPAGSKNLPQLPPDLKRIQQAPSPPCKFALLHPGPTLYEELYWTYL